MKIIRMLAAALALLLPATAASLPAAEAAPLRSSTVATPPTVHGCAYYQFCTYSGDHYNGTIHRMSSCVLHHETMFFQSYVNNQTRGTRARFYNYRLDLLSYTKPAPDKGTTSLGAYTFYILPC
jgi:hypothetical protein